MIEFALSALKIGCSVCLLGLVLGAAAEWSRRARPSPELSRKLIHVGLGLYCLTFPVLFAQTWEVASACALAVGVFALARGRMRGALGAGLHAVARRSHGETYFAVSVAAVFALRQQAGDVYLGDALYVLPIAMLAVSDAAAALVGVRFGRLRFAVRDEVKSCEGSAAFAVTAWAVSFGALTALTPLGAGEAAIASVVLAAVGAAIEAASWRGLDNLLVPLGVHAALAQMITDGRMDWFAAWALLAAALLALAAMMRRAGARFADES